MVKWNMVAIEAAVKNLLDSLPEDQNRAGLNETPERAARAWREWCQGYGRKPQDVLKCFEDGAEQYDEMVLQTEIPVWSTCEHHLAPIFGYAHIGYIPDGKIVGLSKLVRLTDLFARRLQVQERITQQIANALFANLEPLGVGVVLQCRHLCMESRGVNRTGTITTTSCLLGKMRADSSVRSEFLSLACQPRSV